MANFQVRLPDALQERVDALAKRLHGSRSDAICIALAEGLQAIQERNALEAYIGGWH